MKYSISNALKKFALGGASLSLLSFGLFACASQKPATPAEQQTPAAMAPVVPAAPVAVFELKIASEVEQVRVVEKPTLAALDFAAYFENPIRLAGKDEVPDGYTGLMASASLKDYPFPMLDSISEYEPAAVAGVQPISWEPFSKILREKTGSDAFATALASVEAVKWGEDKVFRSFQNVSRLWGVSRNGKLEWYAEVLPAIWTKRAPFYGKLKLEGTAAEAEILQEYLTKELSLEESENWARTLSSYWYPTLNTDLEQHVAGAPWKGSRPFMVMRGNPMGTALWVAMEVPAFRLTDEQLQAMQKPEAVSGPIQRNLDTTSDFRLATLAAVENSCPESEAAANFRTALQAQMAKLPAEQNAWSNPNSDFLWFRRNANYLLASKISDQDSLHNPLPRLLELKNSLDSMGIQLLVVPVPVKEEIYAEKLVEGTAADACVNPVGRAFTQEMLAAGLDVLDLYPALMSAKAGDEAPHYSFQRYDTHWALPGLLAAMEQLATRVTQYSWYGESGAQPGTLTMEEVQTLREGDLVAHLPDAEKVKFGPDTLAGVKITKDSKPYKGDKNSPILLMGDSFTGVFESVDQRSGGPGSLLAYAVGLDVQVVTSWGGGPGVRHRLAKMTKDLEKKRLVIYMMTARDFWQSPMEWDAVQR